MATGKARTTRKSTKSAGKPKTRSAARKTKTSKPAAKRTKTSSVKKPKARAKSTKKPTAGKAAAKYSRKGRSVRKKPTSKVSRAPRARPRPTGQAAPAAVQWGTETIELAPEDQAIPKTKLPRKELRQFKELLLAKRRELVGDVLHLTDQALRGHSSGGSTVPLHMADIGSDNWEQEFALDLIANERALVREIDEALDRIEVRIYGVCVATHRPIETARLRAKPWAKFCVEYARLRELGRVP